MTKVIETDEAGRLVLPPELLGAAKPHQRFVIEAAGKGLLVEQEETRARRQEANERWKQEWDALTEQISASWDTDKSAAQIISEMRR